MESIGRTLMVLGIATAAIGALLYFGGKFLPLGHLPGDFHWGGENFSVHFPLGTCLIISVVLSVLANIFMRR